MTVRNYCALNENNLWYIDKSVIVSYLYRSVRDKTATIDIKFTLIIETNSSFADKCIIVLIDESLLLLILAKLLHESFVCLEIIFKRKGDIFQISLL